MKRARTQRKKRFVALPSALAALAVLAFTPSAGAAVTRSQVSPFKGGGSVKIAEAGSTLLEPLFGLWAAAYHKQYRSVTINPSGGGSGVGISDAAAGTVDIGASDAYISPSDRSQYPSLANIPLAISAQMVNYNVKGVPASAHLKLSGLVLSQIFQGDISYWDNPSIRRLNPGVKLPHEKIYPLHRSDSSGDTFLFTSYLSAADPKGWGQKISFGTTVTFPNLSTAIGETGNGGMVHGCQSTPGCVAYIGISYEADTTGAKLGEAELQNKSGNFELPTASSISAGASAFTVKTPANGTMSMIYGSARSGYPIINYEYAVVSSKDHQANALKSFLRWAVSSSGGSSASYLDKVNFQPLPGAVVKISEALINKI